MNFNWIKTALLAATAMVSLNSFSQDLIARQAPIDRKLKSVDSLACKTDTCGTIIVSGFGFVSQLEQRIRTSLWQCDCA